MDVSKNSVFLPPKSSIKKNKQKGFPWNFHHPFWGVKSPYFWFNTHMLFFLVEEPIDFAAEAAKTAARCRVFLESELEGLSET